MMTTSKKTAEAPISAAAKQADVAKDAADEAAEAAKLAEREQAEAAEAAKAATSADPEPEIGSPAWQRADRERALKEERDALKRAGKDDRVKEVDAELKRVVGRKAPERDET